MNRTLAVTTIAFSFLCITPGALLLSAAAFSTAAAEGERPQAQLARDWTRFPPVDRASCLGSTGSAGTYTDLLECLEAKRDARLLPKQPGAVGQGGPRS